MLTDLEKKDKHSGNCIKELENIKKIQIELKNTITEIKYIIEGIKSRLDDMKKQICKLEEKWKLKRRKKKKSKIMRTVRRTVNLTQMTNIYYYYCRQESLRRNGVAIMVNKRVRNAVLGCNLKNDRVISVRFQGKPFNITVIQVYASTSNAEEAEVERFYEDLQDLLELKPKKDVLFFIGDWNAKVGGQEIPGITGKLGLGVHNEAGKRLTELCQENALVIANTLFQQHKRRLYT